MDSTNLEYHPSGMDMKNWKLAENLCWSFQHMADSLPIATIPCGKGPMAQLPVAYRALDLVILPTVFPEEAPLSMGSVMGTAETDSWMLLHRGQMLTKQYFGEMVSGSQHLELSMSKSLI